MMNPNGQSPDAQAFLMHLLNALFGGQGGVAGGMGGPPPQGGGFGLPSPPPTSMDGGMPPTSGVPQMPKMNFPGSIDKPNAGQQPIGQSPFAGFNRGVPRQRY